MENKVKMEYKTLADMDFKGKKVIMRTGFDVPIDDEGSITDDKRIKLAIPSILYILKDAKQLIIMFHFGRPSA